MKTQFQTCILTTAVAMLSSSGAGLALDPWQNTDLFQQGAGLSAVAADIGTAADGATLYSVGSSDINSTGDHSAIIRKSTDSGASWTTVDDYLEPGWPWASYRGFGAAANGNLFVCGELWDGVPNNGTKTWIVRESADSGSTWGTADAFQQGPTAKPSCGDVKVNPYTGDVFAVGVGNTGGSSGFYWAVRKRANGSANFTTVDMVGAPPINEARAVGFHPTAGVFVVGRMGDGTRDLWTVRRSADGGTTWTTVDTFQDSAKTYSAARGIAVSGSGAIYVCGKAAQVVKGKTVNNWVVRRSLNGGNTWTVVDRFGAEPAPYGSGNATATGITLSPSGNVFVTGATPAPSRLMVRKGTTAAHGTMTWVTSDDFQLVSGQGSEGQGITSDGFGNIFTAGLGKDSTGLSYYLTRTLAGPQ